MSPHAVPSPFPPGWLPKEHREPMSRCFADLDRHPRFVHPWDGLEEHLREIGEDHLRMVGYGSLVNSASAARTILGRGRHTRKPVVAFGIRRVFDYAMSDPHSRYQVPGHPRARALLNVRLTSNPEDAMNGVLIEAEFDDLPALRERESDYNLAPVVCLDWRDFQAAPFLAWILFCPEDTERGRRRLNHDLLPNPHYYGICREGASEHGEDFLAHWLHSTFLADGTTPVAHWEHKLPRPHSAED